VLLSWRSHKLVSMSETPRPRRPLTSSAVQGGTVVVSRALTLYPLRLLVPTAAFIATLLIVIPLGQAGDLRFYQAAATIIVVLVLSLATQGHFFVLRELPEPPEWIARRGRRVNWVWLTSERFAAVGVLSYLGLGEAAALYALAARAPQSILLAVSAGAIASAFFAIGTIALLGQVDGPAHAAPGNADEAG
jgi:hypothetical protein